MVLKGKYAVGMDGRFLSRLSVHCYRLQTTCIIYAHLAVIATSCEPQTLTAVIAATYWGLFRQPHKDLIYKITIKI